MRNFIVLTFLFCFQFTAVMAAKIEANSAPYKSVKHTNASFVKPSIFAKKHVHAINFEAFATNTERILQIVKIPNFVIAIDYSTSYFNFKVSVAQLAKLVNFQRDCSYEFLFKCLYPKHTFW